MKTKNKQKSKKWIYVGYYSYFKSSWLTCNFKLEKIHSKK